MAEQWYVTAGDRVTGPHDRQTLTDLFNAGQLDDEDLVSIDQVVWVSVSDFRDSLQTSDALAESAPVPTDGSSASDEPSWGDPPALPLEASDTAGMPQANETGVLADLVAPGPGERDRIVILGRRAAGKTIYLSTLYAKLWRSLDGMTMSALSGLTHRDAMRIVADLTKGVWPPATQENAQMAFDLKYRRRQRLMVSMDYSGEIFKQAFIEDGSQSREVKELLEHLDRAAAVMLLVDPSMVYEHSGDIDAAVDDDFGMVQAVRRIRDWPGGEDVPIVLVLTKMDLNLPLVRAKGGSAGFVKNHWPALTRTLKHIPIFSVAAVQTHKGSGGKLLPKASSEAINIEDPLKYCLQAMDKIDRQREHEGLMERRERSRQLGEEMVARQERRQQVFWTWVIVGMVLVAAFIIGLILVYN